MPWSTEEADLLLRLRREEKRPWAEVTRLFSEEFPGRSPGAIQVYWSTNLSKRED
jgi:chitinase